MRQREIQGRIRPRRKKSKINKERKKPGRGGDWE